MHDNTKNKCLTFAVGGGAATYQQQQWVELQSPTLFAVGGGLYVLAATLGGATEPYMVLYSGHHNNSPYPS